MERSEGQSTHLFIRRAVLVNIKDVNFVDSRFRDRYLHVVSCSGRTRNECKV